MTAYSAASTAGVKAVGKRSGPVKTRVMVGATLETRSPEALPDEDDVVPLAERVNGRSYNDLVNYQHLWASLWGRNLGGYGEGYFDPKHLSHMAEIVQTADVSSGVETFMGNVFKRWKGLERGYQARKDRVDAAVGRLLRTHAAHLVEIEIATYRDVRLARYQKLIKEAPESPWFEDDEERDQAIEGYQEKIRLVKNPPALFQDTWSRLATATGEFSRLVPGLREPGANLWKQFRHNIRFLRPVAYRGKNRILMVVEIRGGIGDPIDLVFHYGAQHHKLFTKEYRQKIGSTFRVLDRSGRVLAASGKVAMELRKATIRLAFCQRLLRPLLLPLLVRT
jgi:hypothetical protein